MVTNKKWLSLAAASILAAGVMTGCSIGGDDDDSTTSSSGTIKAVDGYVMNAKVRAIYSTTDANTTSKYKTAVDANKSYAKAGTTVLKGSPTYSLAESNSTIAALVKGYEISYFEAGSGYPNTFFDADGNGEFNTSAGDRLVPSNFVMYAPSGYSVATPITSLVYSLTRPEADINESNRTALESDALTKIAAKLGLDATDIKTVDPINAIASKPGYALINSMFGEILENGATIAQLATVATALKTSGTTITDGNVSKAFTNLATAATGVDANVVALFTDIATKLQADPNMINDVKNWNMDKMREGTVTSLNPIKLTSTNKDFNVTSILIDSIETSNMISAGYKFGTGSLNTLKVQATAPDSNKTRTMGITVQIGLEKPYMAKDANITQIVAYIPIDVNGTQGNSNRMQARIAPTSKISYEIVKKDGSTAAADKNLSVLSLASSDVITNSSSTDGNITIKLQELIGRLDRNATSDVNLTWANINKLKINLVDVNSSFQRINGVGSTDVQYWGTTTIASAGATISKEGKTILDLTAADLRATSTGANQANGISDLTHEVGASGLTNLMNSTTLANGTHIAVTEGSSTSYADFNFTVGLVSADRGAYERNTTTSLTVTDKNVSSFVSYVSSISEGTMSLNNNKSNISLRIDSTPTVSGEGHPYSDVNVTTTDEFGKSATNNGTFRVVFNRRPVISFDANTTAATAFNVYLGANGSVYTETNQSANATYVYLYDRIGLVDLDADLYSIVGNSSAMGGGYKGVYGTALTNGTLAIASFAIDANASALALDANVAAGVGQTNGTNYGTYTGNAATNGTYALATNSATTSEVNLFGYNATASFAQVALERISGMTNKYAIKITTNATTAAGNATKGAMANGTVLKLRLWGADMYRGDLNSTNDLYIKFIQNHAD